MVNDLLQIFEEAENKDQVVLDNYIMKNGLYMQIGDGGEIKTRLIKRDNMIPDDLYSWFKKADFYSQLVNMNKSVDKLKKVHSNNIYSFFVKCNILPEVGDPLTGDATKDKKILNLEQLMDSINRYYDTLLEEKNDKATNEILQSFQLGEINKDIANRNRRFLIDNFNIIIDIIKNYKEEEKNFSTKEYIKIFFEAPEEEYVKEYNRYTLPKVFNNNASNVMIDSTVMGLANDNINMNSKKPFLEFKTTKFKVPFRISLEDALSSKKIFDWLNGISRDGKSVNVLNIPIDYDFKTDLGSAVNRSSIYIYKESENGKVIIKDYDIIPSEVKLKEPFEYKNYLGIQKFEERIITDIKALEKVVDEVFYNNQLRYNYFRDDIKPKKDVISSRLIDILFISKSAMREYFHKGQESGIRACLCGVTLELVIDKIMGRESLYWKDVAMGLNLRLNLLRYFQFKGGETMGDKVIGLYNNLKDKLKKDEQVCIESDEEYFFAAGQLARYMISKSEAKNPKQDLFEPFIRAKNSGRMRDVLMTTYNNYNHAISLNYKKFNILFAIVLGYNAKSKIDQGMFLVGASCLNVLYEKKEEVK